MLADMEGLAVTPKILKKAFKSMSRSVLVKRRIKMYLERAKSIGQEFQAIESVSDFIAKELIKQLKRSGAARVQPQFNTTSWRKASILRRREP